MSVTVFTTEYDQTIVTKGRSWQATQFGLHVVDEEGDKVASFREWYSVGLSDDATTTDATNSSDEITVTINAKAIRDCRVKYGYEDAQIVRRIKDEAAKVIERKVWQRLTQDDQ